MGKANLKPASEYTLVDDALIQRLQNSREERKRWLFLHPHRDFEGSWIIESFSNSFLFDLKDEVGPYRDITPAQLASFLAACDQGGYKVAFFDDPALVLDAYSGLKTPPPFTLDSTLPDTVNGMLGFQVQGFNKLKDLDGGVARWDTGTGKSVLAMALVKYHQLKDDFDLCFICVKKNNKVNMQRKLEQLAGVNSILITGDKAQRDKLYGHILDLLMAGEDRIVVIINYEKFRDDFMTFKKVKRNDRMVTVPDQPTDWGWAFFDSTRVICIWDEMPMKLKNRNTQLYGAVCHCLYDTQAPQVNWEKKRPESLRQYMLSATPIENSPEDWFNCMRLIDPRIYGTVKAFQDEYVSYFDFWDPNRPAGWHRLDKMGRVADHVVHEVDKTEPEIAAMFPKTLEEDRYIDWDEGDRKLYESLEGLAAELVETEEEVHVFSLISLLQMVCDAPTMIIDSATHREFYKESLAVWEEGDQEGKKPSEKGSETALQLVTAVQSKMKITNDSHTKLEELRTLLCERHPGVKACVFSTWNETLHPILMERFDEWGVSYVRYNGTDRQKQLAQDEFQQNPEIQVFLSPDSGSDSIDLPEAQMVIDYNQPWKWVTRIQRRNRAHRATSTHETVYFYSLLMPDSVEDRKMKIIARKQGYHQGVFDGMTSTVSASMTKDDLSYILRGS